MMKRCADTLCYIAKLTWSMSNIRVASPVR